MENSTLERPAFNQQIDGVAARQWAEQNWVSLIRYHTRAALVFTERDTGWEDALAELWCDWVETNVCSPGDAGEAWDAFCATHDNGRVRLVLECACRGRGTCTKCGPVRGKIVGDVYVAAAGPAPASS